MNKEVFIKNREKLLEQLPDNSMVVLFAGVAPRKSGDETYAFTPNRNFYYLTGDDETRDILMLVKTPMMSLTHMFILPYDEVQAKWVGETYSREKIQELSGINDVRYLDSFESTLHMYMQHLGCEHLYLDLERQGYNESKTIPQEFAATIKDKYPSVKIENIYGKIAELRMIKSSEEIEEMKKAIHITNLGLEAIMKSIASNKSEKEMQALFEYTVVVNGAEDLAFPTIAASGKNGCVLHYNENNCKIQKDSLALFDLGAQHHYYKADITRTYPVDGKFTPRQRQIYDIVLAGQKLVIESARPGLTTRGLNQLLINYYQEELAKIGLIKNPSEVSKYYFHGVSHHLGLDTHDVSVPCELKPGMVITVEPGLYIAEEGIGIRIEDDVLVTEDGCEVLSKEIIKDPDEIESYMKK